MVGYSGCFEVILKSQIILLIIDYRVIVAIDKYLYINMIWSQRKYKYILCYLLCMLMILCTYIFNKYNI